MQDKEAKALLVPNPMLHNNSEKYIWISDSAIEHRNAQFLFDYFLKCDIYINGFVTETTALFNLKMYNKPIYSLAEIDSGSEVFYEDFEKTGACLNVRWNRARVINPDLGGRNIVIWGAGIIGENVYRILMNSGIKVKCFVDRNRKIAGTVKCGLPVYAPDELETFSEDFTIVETMKNWEYFDNEIRENFHNRFYYDEEEYNICNPISCVVDSERKYLFCLAEYFMFNRFVGKKVYVYGDGIAEKEFVKYLKLMDYDFAGFLVDELTGENDSGNKESYNYIEDILYENGYYIWAFDRQKSKRLKELGLQYFDEYECCNYLYDVTIDRKDQLDINLGYNYLVDSPYQGFVIYGNEKPDNYRIVVLGGSTTDGAMYPFKSWAECLYEELGSDITIYNGGLKGCTSGQELIKFIRDVLPLKPDMVIVYDGANEHNTNLDYPLAFRYADTVFEFAKAHIESDVFLGDDAKIVCYGVKSQKNLFDNWLSNMRSMYAIASERKMTFFSFCQPVLFSKKEKTIQEKNILLSIVNRQSCLDMKALFREYILQTLELPDYIYDLSHIFDGKCEVYMDWCHVWEKGNRIIAEEIKKTILPKINIK